MLKVAAKTTWIGVDGTKLSNHYAVMAFTCMVWNLSVILSMASSVCITMDMWSDDRLTGWMGVTAHCVVDYKLHSFALDFVFADYASHTALNLAIQLREVLLK